MKTGFCFGCGRTREEIAQWMDYSPAQRETVMASLEARLQRVERKPRRITRRRRLAAARTNLANGDDVG
jgi:uncharacterized protein